MIVARNFAIVAVIALLLVLVPGGGRGLDVFIAVLSIVFFAAIAFFGYRLFREHRFTIESLSTRERLVLYGSVALAFFTFTAAERMFDAGGIGVLLWLSLLGVCSFGVYWVFMQSRRYG